MLVSSGAMDESSDKLSAGRAPSIAAALTAVGFRLTGTFAQRLDFRHRSGEPVQIVSDPEPDEDW